MGISVPNDPSRRGKRVENNKVIGVVKVIGKSESAGWKEIERLHLQQLVNESEQPTTPTFACRPNAWRRREACSRQFSAIAPQQKS
jgi:hypothetical protein